MKIFYCVIFIFAAAFSTFCRAEKISAAMSDFKSSNAQKVELRSRGAAVSDDGKTLSLTATGDGYQNILRVGEGALGQNSRYRISFEFACEDGGVFDIEDRKNFLLAYVRNVKIKEVRDYAAKRFFLKKEPQKFVLDFKTNEYSSEYAICLDVHGKVKCEVKNFKAEKIEPDEIFIPFEKNSPAFDVKSLGALPTGSKEFDVLSPAPSGDIEVNAADFGLDENVENCATLINAAIEHCKKIGAAKLVLPKGNYKIFEEVSIKFAGLKDFTFDGNGSTLVYKKRNARNMEIENCERVKFRNFNMDWDWATDPLASLVEVVGISKDGDEGYVDYKFFEYDKFPNRLLRVAYLSGYDMRARAVGYEGCFDKPYETHRNRNPKPRYEWLSDNVLRVFSPSFEIRKMERGLVFRMQHSYYEMGGILMTSNANTTLEDINIWSCSGQAIVLAQTQKLTHLKNVNVTVPNGVRARPISSTADHFILGQSCGYIKLENCDFGYGADDCMNLHDNSAFLTRRSDYALQSISRRNSYLWAVGEELELRHGDLSPSGFTGKVVKVNTLNEKLGIYEVVFSEKLPPVKEEGFVIFNHRFDTRNVIVRNCYFHDNRARGVLILARDVTVENCRFKHNEMGAMKIETGYTFNYWCEGYGVDNVLIRNNVFETSNPHGYKTNGKERDIYIGAYVKRDPSEEHFDYPILRNILFENNTFIDTFGFIAYISSAQNLSFIGNTFINPTPRKNPLPYRASFFVGWAKDINILNNTYVVSDCVKNAGVYIEKGSVGKLNIGGNKFVEK